MSTKKKTAAVAKSMITDYFKQQGGKGAAKKKTGTDADADSIEEEVQKNQPGEEEEKKADEIQPVQNLLPGQFPTFEDFVDGLYSWKKLLSRYTSTPAFQNTYKYVKEQYQLNTCYPPPELIFNAFRLSTLQNTKVVIVGQDPYHQPGQAMGLCFSVPRTMAAPPSLKNMYKVLAGDPAIKNFTTPKHGDLTKWATQGVFLLNDILTVQDSTPASHSKLSGWATFTDEVIKLINIHCDNVVFMLWGLPAQKKAKIVNDSKHHIIKTSHPSPLGAGAGFLTSRCFSKCNDYLISKGKQPIDWNLD